MADMLSCAIAELENDYKSMPGGEELIEKITKVQFIAPFFMYCSNIFHRDSKNTIIHQMWRNLIGL